VTLFHGDALDLLPRLKKPVDIVMTSPPYNTLGKPISDRAVRRPKLGGWLKKIKAIGYDDSMPERTYQAWLNYVLSLSADNCQGLVWMNHKIRFRDGIGIHPLRFIDLPIWNEVVWARAGATNFNCQRFAASHEGLWAFGRPHFWQDESPNLLSVWKINQVANRQDHPCPFPLELARRPILASCPENGVVLDPFAGSCTVGIACLQTGRRFIGFEKNERYLKSAIDRLKNWRSEAVPAKTTAAV